MARDQAGKGTAACLEIHQPPESRALGGFRELSTLPPFLRQEFAALSLLRKLGAVPTPLRYSPLFRERPLRVKVAGLFGTCDNFEISCRERRFNPHPVFGRVSFLLGSQNF